MTSGRPTVSVIIPCHNCAGFVQRAIDSVLQQDYGPVEVVVTDDGSSDNSAALAMERGVNLLVRPHRGAAAARNAGVEASSGDYIAFLDADDFWTGGSLALRMDMFSRTPGLGLVFGNLELRDAATMKCIGWHFDDRRELVEMEREALAPGAFLIKCDPVPYLLRRPFVSTIAAIMPRSVWEDTGGFDESLRIAEDVDLWLRIASRYPIAYTTATVAVYCRRSSSLTGDRRSVVFGLAAAWKKFRTLYGEAYPHLRSLFAENLGLYAYEAGLLKMAERDVAAARRYFATGIRCTPAHKSAWLRYLATFLHL